MLAASEIRSGMAIRVEGELYKVIAADYHAGGGKLGGVTHAKLRNVVTGAIWERRFRAEESVEEGSGTLSSLWPNESTLIAPSSTSKSVISAMRS